MHYFSFDGHFTNFFGHHFVLVNHFRYKDKISFPFYILYSLNVGIIDFKNPKKSILHEGLIMLIMEYIKSLPTPSKSKPHISKDFTPSKDEDSNFIVSKDEGYDIDEDFVTTAGNKRGKPNSSKIMKRGNKKKASPISSNI